MFKGYCRKSKYAKRYIKTGIGKMNNKIMAILLIIIFIDLCCISESPVENNSIKIYEMTEVEVVYYNLYCYNYQAPEQIYDRQRILDKELKIKKGMATGNIQVFENFFGFGGFYSYSEDSLLNASSISFSGVDSLKSNIDILNGKIRIKIYEKPVPSIGIVSIVKDKNLYEFLKENSKGKKYFRIAYITKIYIEGILIN